MGHYDDYYDMDNNKDYETTKRELISEIEYSLIEKDVKELKLILRVVRNTNSILDTIKVFSK